MYKCVDCDDHCIRCDCVELKDDGEDVNIFCPTSSRIKSDKILVGAKVLHKTLLILQFSICAEAISEECANENREQYS